MLKMSQNIDEKLLPKTDKGYKKFYRKFKARRIVQPKYKKGEDLKNYLKRL